ncbi:hypothetical protein A1O3_04495 [Capronia epimyces CBS 606.96]|uniref:Major facilitator superfamily (MFS) profile domain-containing protein n=1 Tax=Capronia epimyces CBS 606.96 TaxID=1182542 RepID=W9YCZ2_9EURO|nr:uncharacterized protein A1O3_04495 [Capronia epimyces CBS 606.96]EXJ87535.1 hypothetical protein A1O3_04495 [Capronia epimyces CBS 606.96]
MASPSLESPSKPVAGVGIDVLSDVSPDTDSSAASASQPKPGAKGGFLGTSLRYLRSLQRYIWDDPDKSKEDKWFLFKLDAFLLGSTCLGYFSKGLDQSNISNAYVSGMREALHMNGSELTYASNVFTAGYVVGQIPAVIMVTRVRPSYLIPTVEILWSVLTFCTSAVSSVSQLYALRFLIGLCESAYFPVVIYMVGAWYTKTERGKRVTLFYSSATLAGMFSGYLQAGAYKGLDGKLGHSGWQWLYIICGIISLPIGVLGYFLFPDFPETTRAFYITEAERERAKERLVRDGLKPLGASTWNRTKILRIMSQWQFWILPIGYFLVQGGFPVHQPAYALWLKSTHHTIYQVNVWPTGQVAVGAVVQILAGMLSDSPLLKGRRWQAMIVMSALTLFATIVLAVWEIPDGLRYVAYYLSWAAAGVPGIYFSWYPDLMSHDHEMRGFMIAVSNIFSYIQIIWFTDVFWRTVEAPKFRKGWIGSSCWGFGLIVLTLVIRSLEHRDIKRRQVHSEGASDVETAGIVTANSDKADTTAPSEPQREEIRLRE